MKTIGIVRFHNDEDANGGIENQVFNIVSNIDNLKYRFVLITNKETKFGNDFNQYGKVYVLKSTKLFKAQKELRGIVKKEQIDILQSHMLREHYICCMAKFFKKNLYHIFRVHTYINCSFISNWRKKIYHILSFVLSHKVDIYLPINKLNYNELIKNSKINKNKIFIIHDGVRSIGYENLKKDINFFDIIMIANLVYGKGHDIALKALKKLVNKDNRYNITFVGSTNNVSNDKKTNIDELKKYAKNNNIENNIQFLGYIDDIRNVIKNKDIVILPSYMEGTPNCLLEAMSAKKIVIASNVGGTSEFINNGKNGFLHKNKDYEELADIILSIRSKKTDEINMIREEGYITWKREYSIDSLCSEMIKVYENIKYLNKYNKN